MFANKYWTSKSSWCFPHLKKQKLVLASKGRSIFLKWWNEVWNEIMRQDSCSALWTTVDLSITSEIQAALAGAPAPCHCQHSLCPRLSGLEWLSLSVIWVSWSHLGAVSRLLHSSQAEGSNREQITRHYLRKVIPWIPRPTLLSLGPHWPDCLLSSPITRQTGVWAYCHISPLVPGFNCYRQENKEHLMGIISSIYHTKNESSIT